MLFRVNLLGLFYNLLFCILSCGMKLKWLLAIFVPIYGFAVWLRNKLFDWGVLKQEEFDIPIISVGNITVGGTGKTPMIEFLIDILSRNYNIAVLSRGYKRKSKGFVLATADSTVSDIGDEPLQILKKFPNVTVAVDADRRRGIAKLMAVEPKIDVILLDDAFQHRYVSPLISILLTDYNRLFFDDSLLPLGRLREFASARYRANIIVVTKCPDSLKPIDKRILIKKMNLYPYQRLFFAVQGYGDMVRLHGSGHDKSEKLSANNLGINPRILAVSGIANPKHFDAYLRSFCKNTSTLHFGDHHDFDRHDIKLIESQFIKMKEKSPGASYIVVTEKDAARLSCMKLPKSIRNDMYVLPVKTVFMDNDGEAISKYIKYTVFSNRRGSMPSPADKANNILM